MIFHFNINAMRQVTTNYRPFQSLYDNIIEI